jgi:catechol 2,3-dioxygenase-like lactoylglutathione lyase family enzyme
MARVIALDHVVIRVSNLERSRLFYTRLFAFLGFECIDDFNETVGWRNGRIAFWIVAGCNRGLPSSSVPAAGLHHCGLELRSRKDVDELQSFLLAQGAEIVDHAAEYYEDYYAVYFKDPDGLKLEGMAYGPRYLHGARRKQARSALGIAGHGKAAP